MFELFTDEARRVVVLAQEAARVRNGNHIGTEHLLLGLIGEGDCVAAKVLESLDVSLAVVPADIEHRIEHDDERPARHIPFTPRAKKALELSQREALLLGHGYIGTEHILLGLIREGEGVAAQVLLRHGADLSVTRQRVSQRLSDDAGEIDSLPIRMFGLESTPHGLRRARPRTRNERLLWAYRRRVPNFMVGWPTWFGNRKASGIRGLPGDVAYLRDSLFRRSDNRD